MPLKPCPFCGDLPETDTECWCDQDGQNDEVIYTVRCVGCGAQNTGFGRTCEEAEDDVFEKWNRRTPC